jgi:hypothetical protein
MNRALLLLPVALALVPAVEARPAYRRALVDLLNLPAASRLNDCRTCHLPPKPGADESDRPHNPFGARLKAVRAELRKAGKPHDITARLLAVAAEDSDGDGAANLLELLAGTFPGDPADRPGEAALAEARKKQTALLASLAGYRWRPFDRVERPAIPQIRNIRNPIDAFLAIEQKKRNVTPRPETSRHVLLRRLTIDLTGLPPTPDELHAFLADTSADAYEKVVDRLLASASHGERWGRHWMDVWRYSDWAGFGAQVRDSQPHVWHWRDWIVESLNAGKGYDRMVLEMLAADELAPTDGDALRATGFLVRNYKLLSRERWLQDAIDHTAQAFLGLTLGCAKCHDHMFDPITQKEYYQFRALFTPHGVRTDRLPGFPDLTKNGLPRAFDSDPMSPTYLLIRGDDRTPDKKPLDPGVPEALGGTFTIAPVSLPRDAHDPGRRAFVGREDLALAAAAIEQARQALEAARRNLARAAPQVMVPSPLLAVTRLAGLDRVQQATALAELDVELARARHEALKAVLAVEALEPAGPKPSPAWEKVAKAATRAQRQVAVLEARRALLVPRKGQPKAVDAAKQALARAEQAARAPESTAYTRRNLPAYPASSTGRRLALARWIVHRDNPLAARVAVNHVWLRHFGQAIVPSVFDFGSNSQPPAHPALLDWLAVEFMERGWDQKALHRLIVTSAAYRRASTPQADSLARDPDNVTLWRYAPRRAEAEVVRDALFFVSGSLDQTMGGPDIPHVQGLVTPRRSLYFQHAQEKQMEFLLLFDSASVTECYQRRQAIMPQQALALGNSDLALTHARRAARRLHAEAASDEGKFVSLAFERVLSRQPTAEEKAECVAFLRARSGRDPLRARENLLHVLVNHHEFVTIR